ncbi:hypothetical protein PROFUN_15356, partial [Planoprotostelium fungivorum]
YRKVRCLACSHIVPLSEALDITKCTNEYIAAFEGTTAPQPMAPQPPPVVYNAASVVEDTQQFKFSKDVNLQLNLKLHVFVGGLDEEYSSSLETGYMVMSKSDEERQGILVLTNKFLYLLVTKKSEKEKAGYAMNMINHYSLMDIQKVIVGLTEQVIQFELAGNVTPYIFLTRDHTSTTSFLESLTNTYLTCGMTPPLIVQFNQQQLEYVKWQLTMQETPLSRSDIDDFHILVYVLLFVPSTRMFHWTAMDREPRSLVISDDFIVMAEEDHTRLASIQNGQFHEGRSFNVTRMQKISDLISVSLSPEGGTVTLQFEEETKDKTVRGRSYVGSVGSRFSSMLRMQPTTYREQDSSQWILYISGRYERNRVLYMLSSKWRELFKVELSIKTE